MKWGTVEGMSLRGCWQEVVERVLTPARPDLERCLAERDAHLAARRLALRDCELRIERARSDVFAANDGVVSATMTALEREWRALHRRDDEMNLWSRIAPASWLDRKLYRDAEPGRRVEAAVALAADVEGVEAAERAIESLRELLAVWGATLAPRVRFVLGAPDSEHCARLLSAPLRAAKERVTALDRATRFEREVHDALLARHPERPVLGRDLAHAAFVDCLIHAAELSPNPVVPLRALWSAGYVLGSVDDAFVTLAIARL